MKPATVVIVLLSTALLSPLDAQGAEPPSTTQPGALRPATSQKGSEGEIPAEVKASVAGNPLLQRLSTVGGEVRFVARSKGAAAYREAVIGTGAVPFMLPTPRGLVQGYATRDGRRLWIAGAMVRDAAAILRIGDLLPLLRVIGIDDREAALGVRTLQVGSSAPPTYTLAMRPGLLWKHREVLEAQRKSGRILYSMTTGRVAVLGAHVLVEGKTGALRVRLVSPQGDQVERIEQVMVPRQCRDLEAALRTSTPKKLIPVARKKLRVPSMTQACAARFLSLVAPKKAPAWLRKALQTERMARPFEIIEALVRVSPDPVEANLKAVLVMIGRTGTVGADAACRAMPLAWIDKLLQRDDLGEATRAVFTRCAWR